MRRPEPLEICQPRSIQEARELLRRSGPGGFFLAGGTDLVIAIKEKGLLPRYLVDLKRIPSLSGIRRAPDGTMTIGALTTMRELELSPIMREHYPFLAQSAAEVGSIQIRHRATVGGNLVNGSPSADIAPALLVLDAQVKIAGSENERTVALETFFLGPGKTVLNEDEILTEILLPPASARLRGEYIKFSPREMMDLAYVGVAVALVPDKGGTACADAKIALGAVAPVPLRARKAEALLKGQTFSEALAEEAGAEAARESRPISDIRSSAEYRREMVRVITKRILMNLWYARKAQVPWTERRDRRY